MTKVKICGIRSVESALAAVDAGADFLGFNFVPTSKRYIDPSVAKTIVDAVKDKVQVVGVFQDVDAKTITKICSLLSLDFVQLHGKETPAFCREIKIPVIKAFALTSDKGSGSNGLRALLSCPWCWACPPFCWST